MPIKTKKFENRKSKKDIPIVIVAANPAPKSKSPPLVSISITDPIPNIQKPQPSNHKDNPPSPPPLPKSNIPAPPPPPPAFNIPAPPPPPPALNIPAPPPPPPLSSTMTQSAKPTENKKPAVESPKSIQDEILRVFQNGSKPNLRPVKARETVDNTPKNSELLTILKKSAANRRDHVKDSSDEDNDGGFD